MELLNKVIKYFTKSQPKNLSELKVCVSESFSNHEGAKVAAITAALHHHSLESNDVKAKVAAIAVALHHHELENSGKNNGLAGLASLVAAIHHHNKSSK
ncbi:MAG: hypothetical protein PHQ22_08815 [Sulfuricurvum sp.]|nr:hypothetical protein [Sulfuricurvum sp.]MDD5387280.1 hypothetical protein [Sulfuricurvum sp.]